MRQGAKEARHFPFRFRSIRHSTGERGVKHSDFIRITGIPRLEIITVDCSRVSRRSRTGCEALGGVFFAASRLHMNTRRRTKISSARSSLRRIFWIRPCRRDRDSPCSGAARREAARFCDLSAVGRAGQARLRTLCSRRSSAHGSSRRPAVSAVKGGAARHRRGLRAVRPAGAASPARTTGRGNCARSSATSAKHFTEPLSLPDGVAFQPVAAVFQHVFPGKLRRTQHRSAHRQAARLLRETDLPVMESISASASTAG